MLYLWVMSISALGTRPRNSGGLCNIDLSIAGDSLPECGGSSGACLRCGGSGVLALAGSTGPPHVRGFGGPRACGGPRIPRTSRECGGAGEYYRAERPVIRVSRTYMLAKSYVRVTKSYVRVTQSYVRVTAGIRSGTGL